MRQELGLAETTPSEPAVTAALLIVEAYEVLGRPPGFASWLRRIANDFSEDEIGETVGEG